MRTILGPFHPELENALVDEILQDKRADPLQPLLIIVPSDSLRRHLKILMGRERRLALLNVQLLTFHQLSLRLCEERMGLDAPVLREDLFLEETLRWLIRKHEPGAEFFTRIEERAGGCAALWQTLRDLRDGLVDPEVALEALREGRLGQGASERNQQLLRLLRSLLRFTKENGINDQYALDKLATDLAPAARFLKQFQRIYYYGFYDLTQVQVDLFHAVARNFPTTLFYPLLPTRPVHEGWSFAARFYERYLQGLDQEPARALTPPDGIFPATFALFDDNAERSYAEPPASWRGTILNTFGMHDEVAAAAKEILRLRDDEKIEFSEIGVVARTLEHYGPLIKELFCAHQIPISGRLEEPLAQFPLAKAVLLLLHLPSEDFPRAAVIDLLSSAYLNLGHLTGDDVAPRTDLWDLATRELAVCKGLDQWRSLRRYSKRDLFIAQASHDDEPRLIRVPAAQLRTLADLVETLAGDLLGLPACASWSRYAAAWQELLEKYLSIAPSQRVSVPDKDAFVREKIFHVLYHLAGLDAVSSEVSLGDFTRTFQFWLERSTVAADQPSGNGVAVLAAAAARGLSFRALFLLGVNEGVFPRTIREDAFLRDRDRETIERDLGCKINPKLAGFDEEKLLFSLLVGAARERLYCSFQRADENGRVLSPSWYLGELKRALNGPGGRVNEITIPRGITDKAAFEPFHRDDLLLPDELAIRLTLDGDDPASLVQAFAHGPGLFTQGRKVVAALDQSTGRLRNFDGMVGPLPAYWKNFSERGLSPTVLETYARCPFQFFARHVLGLERLEWPEEVLGPSAAEFGELGHAILKFFYTSLIEQGYFDGKRVPVDEDEILGAAADRAFNEYEADNPTGYPLAWESIKERLLDLVRQATTRDLAELSESGFAPASLEVDVTDRLADDWREPARGLAIRGRIDRIDFNKADGRLRVIDYKFKLGAAPTSADRDLYRSALRGQRLQPPFYSLLGRRWAEGTAATSAAPGVEAAFYYIAQRWRAGPLVVERFGADGLAGPSGTEIKNTIAFLADGIYRGRFFIQRGEYCGHCEIAEICRKNHPPSLWRVENDPLTAPHGGLRGKEAKKP